MMYHSLLSTKLLLALTALVLSGCASLKQQEISDAAIIELSTVEPMKTQISNGEMNWQLGVIPGDFYGNPESEPFFYVELNDSPRLEVKRLEATFMPFAEKAQDSTGLRHFQIQPQETKLLRVSTFGYNKVTKKRIASGMSTSPEEFIILVYFDRSCFISGDSTVNGTNLSHDINIPSEGFYQIILSETEDGGYFAKAGKKQTSDLPLPVFILNL